MARVLIISAWGGSIVLLRGDLIKEMVRNGHEVIAAAPEAEYKDAIEGFGARFVPIPLVRTSLNPMSDLFFVYKLYKLIKNIKPDVVFSYNIKPVLYGSIAASFAGVSRIYSMIAGLGYAYAGKTLKQRIIAALINLPYKYAVSVCNNVFFQNPDDIKLLTEMGILKEAGKAILINGSGVNLAKFEQKPIPARQTSFILVARMIWDKGIGEYVEAARILKAKYPKARFKLLGPLDSNPNAIRLEQIKRWEDEQGIIEYLGETDDVRPYLAETSVFVLPSFYREGTPRSILEALAVGRPIITTNSPGCRETVRSGVNGMLIPVKNVEVLTQAMEEFILDPQLVSKMGEASRRIAEEKYDVREVNKLIISTMVLG